MDGWMDGWIWRLMDEWMDGYGNIDGLMDSWVSGWMTHQQSFRYLGMGLPGLMCLAQRHYAVMPVRLKQTCGP